MFSKVLVVTDDSCHAKSLETALSSVKGGRFKTEFVSELSSALVRLRDNDIDAVLVELNLPDSQGMATFDQLFAVIPDIPIIIFTEPGDEDLAVDAVHRGARSYLPKGRFGSSLLVRALSNIVQHGEMMETLFIEKKRAETTLNAISDAVITTDILGNVDYMNLAAEKMTGWSRNEAAGHAISEVMPIISGASRKPERNPVELVLQRDEPMGLTAGTVLLRRDGSEAVIEDSASPIHDSAGKLCGAVIVFHDMSASKAMTEKMAHLAQHDFLTNLPNRMLLQDRISQAIELSARRGNTLAVLFLDLDDFKDVNDSLGHDIGDELLRSVAQRLSACVRSSDTVSRSGGDEFIILLVDDGKAENTRAIAEKILVAMAEPQLIAGHELVITTSIGISFYPADARDAETLIKKADMAMYEAKSQGCNNFQFYTSGMNDDKVGKRTIGADRESERAQRDAR